MLSALLHKSCAVKGNFAVATCSCVKFDGRVKTRSHAPRVSVFKNPKRFYEYYIYYIHRILVVQGAFLITAPSARDFHLGVKIDTTTCNPSFTNDNCARAHTGANMAHTNKGERNGKNE